MSSIVFIKVGLGTLCVHGVAVMCCGITATRRVMGSYTYGYAADKTED
jgi:hypothetical protein